jgi:hypothetical protein
LAHAEEDLFYDIVKNKIKDDRGTTHFLRNRTIRLNDRSRNLFQGQSGGKESEIKHEEKNKMTDQ